MKNPSSYIHIYTLLFSVIFITSCYAQDKTNVPQDSTIESITIRNDTSAKGNKAENKITEIPRVDPLFYIEGQLCQHVRRIYQDKSGAIWIGTNVYGLMRYNGDTLEYFSEKDGLGGGRITGIVEDKEGNVWFGTYGGLTKYNGKSLHDGEAAFTNFSEKDGLVNNEVWSLLIDSNGIFWIGTMEGVSRFDGEEFTTFPIPKAAVNDTTTALSYNRITSIMEDRNGIFWFGTDGFGLWKFDPSAALKTGKKNLSADKAGFTHITKEDGLCDNNVTHIMEDKKGCIWIGTMYGGISRYDPSASHRTTEKPLPEGETGFTNFTEKGVVSGVEVWSIYEDKSGNIWFPAENVGVYRYDGKLQPDSEAGFTNFNTTDGLNTNGIQCIFEDKEGRLWLGGWGGLFRYDPALRPGEKSFFSVTKNGPWQ